MKNQEGLKTNNNRQGQSTSNRAFADQNEKLKENRISNSGGQRSDQTSSKRTTRKSEHKKGQ